MKVSISGIDGFIGSALTKALATSTGFELIDQPLFKHSLDDATRLKQEAADCVEGKDSRFAKFFEANHIKSICTQERK